MKDVESWCRVQLFVKTEGESNGGMNEVKRSEVDTLTALFGQRGEFRI